MFSPYEENIFLYRYKCNKKLDGIAIMGSNGEEEGSDDPEISYDCDGAGNYTFDRVNGTNEIILPKCLPRRKYSKKIITVTIIKFIDAKISICSCLLIHLCLQHYDAAA